MNIQSLSIVVPNKECVNKCPFCVSRMVNSNTYPNLMDINHEHYDINVREYQKRMKFVADNNCQTVMLTGTSEPQQNKQFLATFALLHNQIGNPFHNIEMQTTGVFLDGNRNYLRFLRNFVGVNTIAISLNSLDGKTNNKVLSHKHCSMDIDVKRLCNDLRDYDFNIRICCNLTSMFNPETIEFNKMMEILKNEYHADQVTFRKMYSSGKDTPQSKWISKHPFSGTETSQLVNGINSCGMFIGATAYGTPIYDINGMSVIFDDDCMGKCPKNDTFKFLILRPNCKLYSSWDNKASLVF